MLFGRIVRSEVREPGVPIEQQSQVTLPVVGITLAGSISGKSDLLIIRHDRGDRPRPFAETVRGSNHLCDQFARHHGHRHGDCAVPIDDLAAGSYHSDGPTQGEDSSRILQTVSPQANRPPKLEDGFRCVDHAARPRWAARKRVQSIQAQ
jgi:hypothetical protein